MKKKCQFLIRIIAETKSLYRPQKAQRQLRFSFLFQFLIAIIIYLFVLSLKLIRFVIAVFDWYCAKYAAFYFLFAAYIFGMLRPK